MKSVKELEQELELSNAKLSKMTSTVKQLGTKLSDANKDMALANMRADYYMREYNDMYNSISKISLTKDELYDRAVKEDYLIKLRGTF